MKEQAGGKQMKSVWQILPPDRQEKRFGKHPTQKPVALLERIVLASSDPGDLVLDPFLGSGTTAVAALRARRFLVGIEAVPEWHSLVLSRIAAELIFVEIFVDLPLESVDRSFEREKRARKDSQLVHLVQQERKFYFVGANQREVIYSVEARTLEEAWQKFRTSSRSTAAVLFVIKTETEIYLA